MFLQTCSVILDRTQYFTATDYQHRIHPSKDATFLPVIESRIVQTLSISPLSLRQIFLIKILHVVIIRPAYLCLSAAVTIAAYVCKIIISNNADLRDKGIPLLNRQNMLPFTCKRVKCDRYHRMRHSFDVDLNHKLRHAVLPLI
jgi:hypothetical protein